VSVLSTRLIDALKPLNGSVVDDGDTVVVQVDFVDRRYRDAIKAGDLATDRPVTIWSSRG